MPGRIVRARSTSFLGLATAAAMALVVASPAHGDPPPAASTVGPRASRPIAGPMTLQNWRDWRTARAVVAALRAIPGLERRSIVVASRLRTVTLTGRVDSASERRRAGIAAGSVRGVRMVRNRLSLAPEP